MSAAWWNLFGCPTGSGGGRWNPGGDVLRAEGAQASAVQQPVSTPAKTKTKAAASNKADLNSLRAGYRQMEEEERRAEESAQHEKKKRAYERDLKNGKIEDSVKQSLETNKLSLTQIDELTKKADSELEKITEEIKAEYRRTKKKDTMAMRRLLQRKHMIERGIRTMNNNALTLVGNDIHLTTTMTSVIALKALKSAANEASAEKVEKLLEDVGDVTEFTQQISSDLDSVAKELGTMHIDKMEDEDKLLKELDDILEDVTQPQEVEVKKVAIPRAKEKKQKQTEKDTITQVLDAPRAPTHPLLPDVLETPLVKEETDEEMLESPF